jgi:hypothetical protein
MFIPVMPQAFIRRLSWLHHVRVTAALALVILLFALGMKTGYAWRDRQTEDAIIRHWIKEYHVTPPARR